MASASSSFKAAPVDSSANTGPAIPGSHESNIESVPSLDGKRRIDSDPQDRAGRQIDVLASGRRHHAASADQNAGKRAFPAADNAPDDRAHTGGRPDLRHLSTNTFTLERLRHHCVNRISSTVNRELIEDHRKAAFAFDSAGFVDRPDDAAHRGAGWHDDLIGVPP